MGLLGAMTTVQPVPTAAGRDRRRAAPRSSHAIWAPPADRDRSGLLEGQAATRISELVPIRHGRMQVSPFAYFRGAALPMAADLAVTPTSGLTVQLCGDAHLSNFGSSARPSGTCSLVSTTSTRATPDRGSGT